MKGIFYLLTGSAHAARLVVSLHSLRRHYTGPVVLFTTRDESHDVGRDCAADPRLDVEHRRADEVAVRRNGSFLTKIALFLNPPFEVTGYLDCDTMVTGDVSPLLEPGDAEFVATRFADWQTQGRTIRKRIERWRNVRSERFHVEALVDSAIEEPRPSVNGGVLAARRGASILRYWHDLAMDGRRTFICDEVALHLLLHHFPHRLLDCRWNNSPRYGVRKDVRIWHYHGDKHAKPGRGGDNWMEEYRLCVAENVARLAEWGPGADGFVRARLESERSG